MTLFPAKAHSKADRSLSRTPIDRLIVFHLLKFPQLLKLKLKILRTLWFFSTVVQAYQEDGNLLYTVNLHYISIFSSGSITNQNSKSNFFTKLKKKIFFIKYKKSKLALTWYLTHFSGTHRIPSPPILERICI